MTDSNAFPTVVASDYDHFMSPPDQSLSNVEHVRLYTANVRVEKVRAEADAVVLVFVSQRAIRLLLLPWPEPGLL